MSTLIIISDAIKELTYVVTNDEDRKRLGKEIQYLAEQDEHLKKTNDEGGQLVDADEFNGWFEEAYKELKASSSELVEWKSCVGHLSGEYTLNAYKPIPKFKSRKEIEAFIHKLEDEMDELIVENIELRKLIEPGTVQYSNGEVSGEYKFNGGDAIRAINELNKMDGDHATDKKEITGNGGVALFKVKYIRPKR